MTERSGRWPFWCLAAVVVAVAFFIRVSYDVNRSQDPRTGEWVSLEPDSFYQMRRTARVLDEGWPVAGTDPVLDFPDGAEIPWPPYYAVLLAAIATVAIDAPGDPGAWLEIERLVASLPLLFSCLCVLLAAWAARRLAGDVAAAFAGLSTALALGSVAYGGIGNGDHHAFVALLHVGLLLGLTVVLQRGILQRPREAVLWGVALGAVVGLGLGTWVAFMAYLIEVELVLVVLLFGHTRRSLAGLAGFGLALHCSAFLFLLPAVLQSPWQGVQPWSVVNLSAFHPFFLAVGGAVFVPLLSPRLGERVRRSYPWIVGVLLALLFGALFAVGGGPGAGLREAFSWASREDRFMASIHESTSIFDDFGTGLRQLMVSSGYLIGLLPLAWVFATLAWRRGQSGLLPWIAATPLLLLQSLSQLRFAEALVAPAAVLVGWGVASLMARGELRRPASRALLVGVALLLGAASQWPSVAEISRYRERSTQVAEPTELQQQLGATRRMCAWLRGERNVPGQQAVLASWGDGHMIEWVAKRPTIATNFGSYLGESSYRFGPRVFLCEDDAQLEQLLEERQIGYLLLNSRLTEMLPDLISRADPGLLHEYLAGLKNGWSGGLRPRWFRTALARLVLAGSESGAELPASAREPIGFLRLVHVAGELDPAPPLRGLLSRSPRGWIWQRVAGARLVFHGTPGSTFGVRFGLRYTGSDVRLRFEASGVLGSDGTGSLRVPYQTDADNGDGRVLPGALYWIGGGRQALEIPSENVMEGTTLDLY